MNTDVRHSDIIMHHGIKGQRWGVRRYQNEDGSLTSAGKKKQKSDGEDKVDAERKINKGKTAVKKILKGIGITTGVTTLAAGTAATAGLLYLNSHPEKVENLAKTLLATAFVLSPAWSKK